MAQSTTDKHWYVLTVAPQHEFSVVRHLQTKDFEASAPAYQVRRRWSDRIKTLTLPLFPGYVFCRFAAERRAPVLSTPSVRGVISFGSQLASLEEHEMERIHRIAASGLQVEPLAGLQTGMRVNIIDGPLCGLTGVLAQIDGAARVVVNVELLNRAVAVQIVPDAISPVKETTMAASA